MFKLGYQAVMLLPDKKINKNGAWKFLIDLDHLNRNRK